MMACSGRVGLAALAQASLTFVMQLRDVWFAFSINHFQFLNGNLCILTYFFPPSFPLSESQ